MEQNRLARLTGHLPCGVCNDHGKVNQCAVAPYTMWVQHLAWRRIAIVPSGIGKRECAPRC
jgi:hypothetical protein